MQYKIMDYCKLQVTITVSVSFERTWNQGLHYNLVIIMLYNILKHLTNYDAEHNLHPNTYTQTYTQIHINTPTLTRVCVCLCICL